VHFLPLAFFALGRCLDLSVYCTACIYGVNDDDMIIKNWQWWWST